MLKNLIFNSGITDIFIDLGAALIFILLIYFSEVTQLNQKLTLMKKVSNYLLELRNGLQVY